MTDADTCINTVFQFPYETTGLKKGWFVDRNYFSCDELINEAPMGIFRMKKQFVVKSFAEPGVW